MRIALLPSAYSPLVGGVEELTRRLARQLVRCGHAVEVWTPHRDGLELESEIDGIRVRRFPMPLPPAQVAPVLRFPFEGGKALREILRAVKNFNPDLLHVQCFSVNGAYATAASHLTGVPLVVTLQGETLGDEHDIFERSMALRWFLRRGLRRAAAVTSCSRFVLDDAAARFGPVDGQGEVIFNGVDLTETATEPVALPWERFVLCLGRLVEKKGFDLVLDAFPAVVDRHPEVGLVVAGEGSARDALEHQAEKSGLSRSVFFTGALDRPRVNWVMRHAEVCVIPSRVEGFGIVVLEAWRAGCPPVVSSLGGTPEFVRDGVDALLRDPTNQPALGQAVCELLENAAVRRSLSHEGRRRVQEFDWSVITAQYERLYAGVLAGENQVRSA